MYRDNDDEYHGIGWNTGTCLLRVYVHVVLEYRVHVCTVYSSRCTRVHSGIRPRNLGSNSICSHPRHQRAKVRSGSLAVCRSSNFRFLGLFCFCVFGGASNCDGFTVLDGKALFESEVDTKAKSMCSLVCPDLLCHVVRLLDQRSRVVPAELSQPQCMNGWLVV